jgi:voltage-dependent potassium channel beta subunit
MEYRHLGRSGLKVSAISLGGWTTFGGSVKESQMVHDIIRRAYDAGVNFYDIADAYAKGESERMMGEVLKEFPRHTLVISSKLYWPQSDDPNDRGLSRKHIMESIDKSLKRIGTDYLDLYFCHRYDDTTPLLETMRAMDDLIHRGKILYWGTSEWSAAQIEEAHALAAKHNLHAPQVEQPQFSLLVRRKFEQEVAPAAMKHGMGLVVWSPLASGLLTGKYDEGMPEGARLTEIEWLRSSWMTEDRLKRVRNFAQVAGKLETTRAQVALAWALNHKGVSSVITGATKVEQLEENLRAATLELSPDILAQIDDIFPPDLG